MTEVGDRLRISGEAILFGFPSTQAVMNVRVRPAAWRASHAAARMGGFTVMAGVVALLPPHVPWLLGSLTTGAVLARRRWIERHTLESVECACPKCGAALRVKASRLRAPHPVACEACHHESALRFDTGVLG
jgi:hypothetical protein